MKIIFVLCLAFLSVAKSEDFSDDNYCPNGEYDDELNKCINSICPSNSTGTYPNCKCTEKNFDYSHDVNDCFRVCPENSTGYFPNCICDDKNEAFDPTTFKCISCTSDSRGIYPNCDCGENGTYDKQFNKCQKCEGAKGIYPHCECDDITKIYNPNSNGCIYCPENCRGSLPDCICEHENVEESVSNECPFDSTGYYPNCKCNDSGIFEDGKCKRCGWPSKGTYPNCICKYGGTYNKVEMICQSCLGYSTGKYPNCTCVKPFGYDAKVNRCIKCPITATGVFPHCRCTDNKHIFSAYINECFIPCPENSQGIHPECQCEKKNMTYDEEKRDCVSIFGRKCPKLSIGIGPDCLCIKYNYNENKPYEFNKVSWTCVSESIFTHFHVHRCPDTSYSWPMCDEAIKKNALLLLVGG